MDPKACLERAKRALNAGLFSEADEALGDYVTWRTNGGFEPKDMHLPGDELHEYLCDSLAMQLRQRGESP